MLFLLNRVKNSLKFLMITQFNDIFEDLRMIGKNMYKTHLVIVYQVSGILKFIVTTSYYKKDKTVLIV